MRIFIKTLLAVLIPFVLFAQEMSNEEIAKASQNPITMIYSLPIQNNMYMGLGHDNKMKNVANFQPVIPIGMTENTDLVLRMIMPITTVPKSVFDPGFGCEFDNKEHSYDRDDHCDNDYVTGLGDITLSGFFAPKKVGKLIWGAGFAAYFPTATIQQIRTNQWGLGPAFVGLTMLGKWTMGALIMNIWALNSPEIGRKINFLQIQPFLNFNLGDGWYFTSVPIILVSWEASEGNKWTVPLGGGVGKGFKIGKLPVSATVQAYYNVVKPDVVGEKWQLRLQAQVFFPRKK